MGEPGKPSRAASIQLRPPQNADPENHELTGLLEATDLGEIRYTANANAYMPIIFSWNGKTEHFLHVGCDQREGRPEAHMSDEGATSTFSVY